MALLGGGLLGALGSIVGIAGQIFQFIGQRRMIEGQRIAIRAQERAERARERQMELDAIRRRREVARAGMVARAQAVASANSQGALVGSGIEGGLAQITGQENRESLAISQNEALGANVFASRREELRGNMVSLNGQSMANFGSGLTSLGNALVENQGLFQRIGGGFGINTRRRRQQTSFA